MTQPLVAGQKLYILDTNVLVADPHALLKFEEHDVAVPLPVLEELDRLKVENSDRGRQARTASHVLDRLLEPLGLQPKAGGHKSGTAPIEVQLDHGEYKASGRLIIPLMDPADLPGLDHSIPDNKILGTAQTLARHYSEREMAIVSNDTNLRLKAYALGLAAQPYRNDQVISDSDAMTSGRWTATEDSSIFEQVDSMTQLGHHDSHTWFRLNGDIVSAWHPGMVVQDPMSESCYLVTEADGQQATLRTIGEEGSVWGVRPSDDLQRAALTLLLDDQFDLVSLAGKAGTGKTFLAMAAALHLTLDDRRFDRILITRETVEMGQKIGFLKGTEEEKLGPWFGGFFDNIKALTELGDDLSGQAGMTHIMDKIEMRSIGLMRGRSIQNSIIILDEAQNLSQAQIKNLVSRAGEGSKIIVLGNIAQVDTPFLTPQSCGLAWLVERMKPSPHAAHLTLEGINRSRLAIEAEKYLI